MEIDELIQKKVNSCNPELDDLQNNDKEQGNNTNSSFRATENKRWGQIKGLSTSFPSGIGRLKRNKKAAVFKPQPETMQTESKVISLIINKMSLTSPVKDSINMIFNDSTAEEIKTQQKKPDIKLQAEIPSIQADQTLSGKTTQDKEEVKLEIQQNPANTAIVELSTISSGNEPLNREVSKSATILPTPDQELDEKIKLSNQRQPGSVVPLQRNSQAKLMTKQDKVMQLLKKQGILKQAIKADFKKAESKKQKAKIEPKVEEIVKKEIKKEPLSFKDFKIDYTKVGLPSGVIKFGQRLSQILSQKNSQKNDSQPRVEGDTEKPPINMEMVDGILQIISKSNRGKKGAGAGAGKSKTPKKPKAVKAVKEVNKVKKPRAASAVAKKPATTKKQSTIDSKLRSLVKDDEDADDDLKSIAKKVARLSQRSKSSKTQSQASATEALGGSQASTVTRAVDEEGLLLIRGSGKIKRRTKKNKPAPEILFTQETLDKLKSFERGSDFKPTQRSTVDCTNIDDETIGYTEAESGSVTPEKVLNKQKPNANSLSNKKLSLADKLLPIFDGPQRSQLIEEVGLRQSKKNQLMRAQRPSFLIAHYERAAKDTDTDYDASKMTMTDHDWLMLSPGMQRYWELKKEVMDAILFYRFGAWYVLYFDDMVLANKYIRIEVTPHYGAALVGFHSRFLMKNVQQLTNLGFKVAVAEQQETQSTMLNNNAIQKIKAPKKRKKGAPKGSQDFSTYENTDSSQGGLSQPATEDTEPVGLDSMMLEQKRKARTPMKPEKDNIKAVKRKITNIFTKGTCSSVQQAVFRIRAEEQQQQNQQREKGEGIGDIQQTLFQESALKDDLFSPQNAALSETRNILFFIRDSFSEQELEIRQTQNPNPPPPDLEAKNAIGFVFFDISILKVYAGVIDADTQFNQLEQFKALLMQIRPVEIVTNIGEKVQQTIKFIKNFLQVQPLISYLTQDQILDIPQILSSLQETFQNDGLEQFEKPELIALSLALRYLQKNKLTLNTMPFFQFYSYKKHFVNQESENFDSEFFMDATTLKNLNIFGGNNQLDNIQKENGDDQNSLFASSAFFKQMSPQKPAHQPQQTRNIMQVIDTTTTPFGHRLLHKWICYPITAQKTADDELKALGRLKQRQDSVEDLVSNYGAVLAFHKHARKLSDIERLLTQVYNYSIKTVDQQNVFSDYQWSRRLSFFKKILGHLKYLLQIVPDVFAQYKSKFKSARLRSLCSLRPIKMVSSQQQNSLDSQQSDKLDVNSQPENNGAQASSSQPTIDPRQLNQMECEYGLIDNYLPLVRIFEKSMIYNPYTYNYMLPRPKKGRNQGIDKVSEKIDYLKGILQAFLKKAQTKFRCKDISYIHNKTYQYQIVVPAEIINQVQSNHENKEEGVDDNFSHQFIILGKIYGGKRRFTCDYLLELSLKLQDGERNYKRRMIPIIRDLFQRFYSYREYWANAISCISELDVLCALATYSRQAGMCKPTMICDYKLDISDNIDQSEPNLKIEGLRNPLCSLEMEMQSTNNLFVKPENSSIELMPSGGGKSSYCLLVKGTNRADKQKLLRACALSVILAQIGCYVPADSYQGTLFDRIFTRINLHDASTLNKSTLADELLETNQILQQATSKSLVIIDDLGRGTSTIDGYAIAKAVLDYLIRKVSCVTIFTTHYKWLVDDYVNDVEIELYTLLCKKVSRSPQKVPTDELQTDADSGQSQMSRSDIFQCNFNSDDKDDEMSFAKSAGLPERIIFKAEKMSANRKLPLHLKVVSPEKMAIY